MKLPKVDLTKLLAGLFKSGDDEYEHRWWRMTDDGAGFVANAGLALSQNYVEDLVMDDTAQSVAIPSGTKAITIFNEGAATETIRCAFGVGVNGSDAESYLTHDTDHATTGIKVPSIADSEFHCLFESRKPALATHVAVENAVAGDRQAVQIAFWG